MITDCDGSAVVTLSVKEALLVKEALKLLPDWPAITATAQKVLAKIEEAEDFEIKRDKTIFLRLHYDSPYCQQALEELLKYPPRVEEGVCGFVGNPKLLREQDVDPNSPARDHR